MKQRDLDHLLATYFEQTAPVREPDGLVEQVLAITSRTEPRRSWAVTLGSVVGTAFRGKPSALAPLATALAVVVLVAGAGLFLLRGVPGNIGGPLATPSSSPSGSGSDTRESPTPVRPEALSECAATYAADAATVTAIPLAGPPAYTAAAAGSIWVATTTAGTVDRIDPTTNQVLASIAVAEPATSDDIAVMAVAGASGDADGTDEVWAAVRSPDRKLVRIDPSTNEVTEEIPVPWTAYNMLIREGTNGAPDVAWVSDYESLRVGAVDLESGEVVADVRVPGGTVQIALAGNEIWIPNNDVSSVSVIDADNPDDGVIATHEAPLRPTYLATDGNGTVWGTNARGSIFTFSSGSGTERHHYHNNRGAPNHVTTNGSTRVYVNTYYEGRPAELVAIDADARCILGRFRYPEEAMDPWMLSYAEGSVWAGNQGVSTLVRFDVPEAP